MKACGVQGREEVFGFLEGVLLEVLDLFPSQYIHVGGDEVREGGRCCCGRRLAGWLMATQIWQHNLLGLIDH